MSENAKPVLPEMGSLWKETLNWQPDAGHLLEFQSIYELILEGNQQMNLTRITEPQEFWEKHLWDSLRGVAPLLESPMVGTNPPATSGEEESSARESGEVEELEVIDLGTGAGFPGLPIAIARPEWTVTLLDSTRKKLAFLDRAIDTMGMENVRTLTARAEEIGQQSQHREAYDIAVARALAPPPVCAEYALPLLKIGGVAVLYRGRWTDEESDELSAAVEQLGGILDFIERFKTPLTGSTRTCVYLRKIAPTPAEFPRSVGVPREKPLSRNRADR
jgi:16S rRNA (guanine527-N7)-methyltransferase